jgi:multidrug transporter EmrE-like cation transporter
MGYLYIFGTIFFTVYGQIIIKWQIRTSGGIPSHFPDSIYFILKFIINPWIISSLTAAFLAFLCWVAALNKFDLSFAYPFMSLSFALVLILGWLLFSEPMSIPKVVGIVMIFAGVIVGSQG